MNKQIIITARQHVGLYLRSVRQEKKLTLYAVAKLSGIKQAQLKAIESGSHSYTIDTFMKVIRVLDCYFILKDRQGRHLDMDHLHNAMQQPDQEPPEPPN